MRLTILGSSGTYPVKDNPASGYLVTHASTSVWIDAGPGTFMALLNHVDLGDVDAVVISHVHPDHCSDLFAAYHHLAYGPGGGPIPVYVPDGIAEAFGDFVGADKDHALWQAFEFRTVKGGDALNVAGMLITFADTDHPVPTIATRAEADGRILSYSSDTGPGGDAFDLAAGSDVFLCEATFQGEPDANPSPHHLTAIEAGTLAAAAGCRRLVLTHIHPMLDRSTSIAEAESVFGGEVIAPLAGDGVEV